MARDSAEVWNELDGPRSIREEEIEAARRLWVLCFRNTVIDGDPASEYVLPAWGSIEVICRRGIAVSQIGIYHSWLSVCGSRFQIASIGGVCTHPDYRGFGLGTRLLQHCERKLVAEGARLLLVSGGRGLYLRAGCTPAQRFDQTTLRPGQLRPAGHGVTIRRAAPADAALCARLNQMEPAHFVRRVEDFEESLRLDCGPDGDFWIVEVRGRPVAYLVAGVPWGYRRDQHVREVLEQGEYAGSRVALAEALGELVERLGLDEFRIAVPWQDVDFCELLRERAIVLEPTPLYGHTMRIVDFAGLMADLHPYLHQRLTEEQRHGLSFQQHGDRCTIALGGERIELDGAAMTRMVLGVPPTAEYGTPVVTGALGDVISALFPLPSVTPGLNVR